MSGGQVITVANREQNGSTKIEFFEFADGSVWNADDIVGKIQIEGQNNIVDDSWALNLLVQSYSSFDDASEENDLNIDNRVLSSTPIYKL